MQRCKRLKYRIPKIFVSDENKNDYTKYIFDKIILPLLNNKTTFNVSGYLYVYFPFNKILIIPGYLLMYFYYKHPILNYKLILINNSFIHFFKEDDKTRLLQEDLFKILNNTKVGNPNTLSAYISSLIFSNNNIITKYQNDLFQDISVKKYYINEISENFQNEFFTQNRVKYIDCKTVGLKIDIIEKPRVGTSSSRSSSMSGMSSSMSGMSGMSGLSSSMSYTPGLSRFLHTSSDYNKYLKYKLKYLNLKKSLIKNS